MIQLFVFLTSALLLLGILLVWVYRATSAAPSRGEISEVHETLAQLKLELPPRAVVERILDREDWEFVSRQASPQIQRLFLLERKALALAWLRESRKRVGQLMDFYRRAVRSNVRLSPALEIRLAIDYLLFVLLCKTLLILIWVRGPFAARSPIGYVAGLADKVSLLPGSLLVKLDSENA